MANKADYEAHNRAFAAAFNKDTTGKLPLPPKRQSLILACMDARLHPTRALGLEIGDSHVVRNAGGRVTPDAIRSISISQRLLGTNEVVIIHHTDCGMLTFKNDEIKAKIATDLGAEAGEEAKPIEFFPFSDLAESIREDIRRVKASKIIQPNTPVYGYVYHVETGVLEEIKP